MIDNGANPHVVPYAGSDYTQSELENLGHLSNLPTQKSVFFTTRPFPDDFKNQTIFPDPWFYRTGVFGQFESVIGQGASGTVLSGDWFGQKAAFKFVEIGLQQFQSDASEALKTLDEKLTEMTSIQAAKGDKVLPFYGHYR